ncbi:hypothetical protein [Roseofilum casamattae]|uniref:CopG family transcriptional regulator n=1 Tax=Roseofilum casamattae BLCC-M143 TaxID=3022442 RepID=A0ABT7BVW9_9CYAN|nr:hypothetical protein [Roseofilum casamattae]MDJ1182601.1 hypothetical protein [Roseofilum casamattae BLCC-M143]
MTSKRKLVTFKADEKLWKDFKVVCGKSTATDAFIGFMMRCIEEGKLPSDGRVSDDQYAALEKRVATLETLILQCQEQYALLSKTANPRRGTT